MRFELPSVLQRVLDRSNPDADQALLSGLRDSHPAAAAELAQAIDSSPHLEKMLDKAHRDGLLSSIRFTNESVSARYVAQEGSILLNPRRIEQYLSRPHGQTQEALHDFLVTTLAHEASHALESKASTRHIGQLHRQVRASLKQASHGGVADITDAAADYLSERRMSEARAEQAAYNALSSRISHATGQAPDADTLARRSLLASNCTDIPRGGEPRLAAGLSPDARGMIPDNQLEALAQCFYDNGPANLGKHGNVDYHHAYAGFVLRVVEHEKRGGKMEQVPVQLDFERLGLDPARVQDAGLDFGAPGRGLQVHDAGGRKLRFIHDAGRDVHVGHADGIDPRQQDDPLHRHVQDSVGALLPQGVSMSQTRLAQVTDAARQAGIRPGEPIELVAHDGGLVVRGHHPAHVARVDLDAVPGPHRAEAHATPTAMHHGRDLHG